MVPLLDDAGCVCACRSLGYVHPVLMALLTARRRFREDGLGVSELMPMRGLGRNELLWRRCLWQARV